ncbi:MOXD1 homolog 1-like isoform X2 [Rhodnius prolixus]|uniref:MOXD1 homolog 1-like isoform X2 n=1 Tax=Rhodnius prolixus TaxID=13249 RepID=UPI003D18E4CD
MQDGHRTGAEDSPVEDPFQNYRLLQSRQNNTHTVIKFSRLWDTCDREGDVIIGNGTVKLMWSVGSADPKRTGWSGVGWRGPKSLHISAPPLLKPEEAKIFWDVLAQDFTVPDSSISFYWCKIYKIPFLDEKHHIIGYTPQIESGHEKLIEHMLLYECLGGSEFEIFGSHPGAPCRSAAAPKQWTSCSTPIVSWATGSTGEFFPSSVGLPMAEGEGKATYFMLEIHYENPSLMKVKDNSGLRIYYTPLLRPFDGSILTVGVAPSSLQIVPPIQRKFSNVGYCDHQCTNLMFPESGIKVVSVVFHTHSAGRQVRLRHVREGKELAVIAEDNYYDPGYQQSIRILGETVILPRDDIITECSYNTQNRTKITLGGYTLKEETCLAYLLYYPRTALSSCTSTTAVDFFFGAFGIKEFYDMDLMEVEKFILKESEKQFSKFSKPHIPKQSLFFSFSEKEGFNIDASKASVSIWKAVSEINIDNDDNILSRLVIYKPEEFQNKTFLGHLRDLPWQEKLFTLRAEEILNKGKYRTFCRLQNSVLAMPSAVYSFPNFTSINGTNNFESSCIMELSSSTSPSLFQSAENLLLAATSLFIRYLV